MVGMAFSIGSPFSPALPRPYRLTFMGVAPGMVIEFTSDPTADPPATLVSPAVVVAVPPMGNRGAFAKENRPFGTGDDAAARAGDGSSVRPSNVSLGCAI